jgi:OOP family OmpA-OmpF porin
MYKQFIHLLKEKIEMFKNGKYFPFIITITLLFCIASSISAQEDWQDCKDHPFFSRMTDYYISECETIDFDAYEFIDPFSQDKKKVTVEGKKYVLKYSLKDNAKAASALAIRRNYVNAFDKLGGSSVEEGYNLYTKFAKNNLEIWAHLDSYASYGYSWYKLTLIEKTEMVQNVLADAKTMETEIRTSGRIALYGILFDFNKYEVKPESDPTLKEIASLLSKNPSLKLYVVGHTDNVGKLDYNIKLSEQRAEAVKKILETTYKVSGGKLYDYGVGPLSPVATNETEDGREKNRRVELVKQ